MADLQGRRRRRRQRRRALRHAQRRHAPRARVREHLRPAGHPARRGPRAHRGRARCTRARSRRGSACAAGRASPRTSSSRATCCSPSTRGARYHVAHVSTLGAVRILREAKSRGIAVTAEVTPHHLLLTDAALLGYDTACKVNPPLREAEDVDALRDALADGTIDCIATDHAPHSPLEKDCEFAEAAPGHDRPRALLRRSCSASSSKGILPLGRAGRRADARARRASSASSAPTLAEGARGEPRRSSIPKRDVDGRAGAPALEEQEHAVPGQTMKGMVLADAGRAARIAFDVLERSGGLTTMDRRSERAYLVLADGTVFDGRPFGARGTHHRRGRVHDRR